MVEHLLFVLMIIFGLTSIILIHKMKTLSTKIKYNYESKILEILGDAKKIENKYATAGTEMCRYLEDKIAYHSRIYYTQKNKLDID